MTPSDTLEKALRKISKPGEFYEKLSGQQVRCYACGHRCVIPESRQGICKVRHNEQGVLYVPSGYAAVLQDDPIEKKPFFHALPGSRALSFGMLGCDFHCGYCQNWVTSQALRDPAAGVSPELISARELVSMAKKADAKVVASTYNEPLITSEWALEVFREARPAGLRTAYVSNGNATPEILEALKPWLDFYKVDLKSFNDKRYRELGGVLQNVLDTIRLLHKKKIWLEVLTLVIPGFNDSTAEIRDIAQFICSVSSDIPWHVTAFHKDYKMQDNDDTTAKDLMRVAEIGYQAGLRYVYAGNLPGRVGPYEDTVCPGCKKVLIKRFGFKIQANILDAEGKCPDCATLIPGVWS